MGREPRCEKTGLRRGPWSVDEDHKLMTFILNNGIQCWRLIPKLAGLMRCGKSCRLRWINYLRPDLKRGAFTEDEEDMIIELQSRLGNRWSKIAANFPGRTDNEIKNYWNTRIKKKMKFLNIDTHTYNPKEQRHDQQDTTISPLTNFATFNNFEMKEERFDVFDDQTPVIRDKTPAIGDIGTVMAHEHELNQSSSTCYMKRADFDFSQNWGDCSGLHWETLNGLPLTPY